MAQPNYPNTVAGTSANKRLRHFVLTLNNYKEPDDLDRIKALPIKYVLIAREVGESGTPHYQGYVELTKQCGFTAVCKALNNRAHIEPREGTPARAIEYCKKGEQSKQEWTAQGKHGPNYGKNVDIALEEGTLGEPGKRTDLLEVVASLQSGKRLSEVAAESPEVFIKYAKGIERYHALLDKPRDKNDPIEIIVHYGPTGTGKTWKALADYPDAFKYSITCSQWFDGYEGQEVAVFDEFRAQLPFGMILQLLDHYALKVAVKGGFREWKPKKVILTSPVHPAFWYSPETLAKHDGSIEQLKRRINAIYFFESRGVIRDHSNMTWPTHP